MELSEAIELIQNSRFPQADTAVWADLGCGSGLFTFALAHFLPAGSTIHAVDKEPVAFNGSPRPEGTIVQPWKLDFIAELLPFRDLDGILMANSLHYVSDKKGLIKRLSTYMKPDGPFLIVEYDTDKPVPHWVPYPVSFRSLQPLFAGLGYKNVEKLGERPSVYGRAGMYAAWIAR